MTRRKRDITPNEIADRINTRLARRHAPELLDYYADLAAGLDPRGRCSQLYRVVKAEYNERAPRGFEWEELKMLILSPEYRQARVTVDQSSAAAKTLLEFAYPKKRAVDHTAQVAAEPEDVEPLTTEEIRDFQDWFDTNFLRRTRRVNEQ